MAFDTSSVFLAHAAAQAEAAASAALFSSSLGDSLAQRELSPARLTRTEFSRRLGAGVALALVVGGTSTAQAEPAQNVRKETAYHTSQVEVMDRMRTDRHQDDQALFALGVGGALLFGLVIGFVFGRRSGKKAAMRQIELNAGGAQQTTPPRTDKPSAST